MKLEKVVSPRSRSIYTVYPLNAALTCANTYHDGKAHMLKDVKTERIDKLLQLINALNLTSVEVIDENSFKFESKNARKHRFIFKLCRYVRSESIFKIIETAIEAMEQGVKPYNAILIGHYIDEPKYYVNHMDIINKASWRIGFITKGYKTEKEFIARFTGGRMINSIFTSIRSAECNNILTLVRNKEYLAAEKILENY